MIWALEGACQIRADALASFPSVGARAQRANQHLCRAPGPAQPRVSLHSPAAAQAFAAGVGNWVADEILYCARLHPEQPVADLGREHVAALHEAVRSVVATAVAVRADAARYPPGWIFHSRSGSCVGGGARGGCVGGTTRGRAAG
jgi:formamidopyrimidine-DNA glycosylase